MLGHAADQTLLAHAGERVVAAAALQHAEAKQDRDARRCARSARYRKPARRISGMRCSVVTRKYDASAIVSHATMNTYASSATSTSAIAARNAWYWKQMRPGAVPSLVRK